jgi:hypothetical protein
MEPKVPEGTNQGSNASSTGWLQANPEGKRLMHIVQALITADPWIGNILDGSKTWEQQDLEMQSSPTQVPGAFSLIRET